MWNLERNKFDFLCLQEYFFKNPRVCYKVAQLEKRVSQLCQYTIERFFRI